MTGWRVFWVPRARAVDPQRVPVLAGLEDLVEREERTGIHTGDPIILSPDYRIDESLSLFLCRSSFARLAAETKRNYTDDYAIFFDFLWARGKVWDEATADDLWDFEDWRTRSPRNPQKVGAARWNRSLAALTRLYKWAVATENMASNPILMNAVVGYQGDVVQTPEARAKEAKSSDVHWLTPRMFGSGWTSACAATQRRACRRRAGADAWKPATSPSPPRRRWPAGSTAPHTACRCAGDRPAPAGPAGCRRHGRRSVSAVTVAPCGRALASRYGP